jgi:hypothetical protein
MQQGATRDRGAGGQNKKAYVGQVTTFSRRFNEMKNYHEVSLSYIYGDR